MGQFGKAVAQVTIESDWWSKINWTQVVGWICSGLSIWTTGKFDVSPSTQINIVLTIQAISGLLTIWLRRNSTTITPTAAAKLERSPHR
jgi:hypothetical protein